MTTTTTRVIGGIGAAVLAGGLWAAGTLDAPSAEAHPTSGVLRLDARTSTFFLLDFGPTGVTTVTSFSDPFTPSKGDQTVFRDELLRDGRVVGHDGGVCTVTEDPLAGASTFPLTCQVTFEIDGDQVTSQGLATNDPAKHLAVTGGTGRYSGAAGTVTLTENGDDTASVVFRFDRRRR